ncbi:Uncharacterized protein Adt_36101 [Abeliophyllum distichum]|uniref:Uncharacterized protein n=1 Tax=Abeliophyllum distichum TaxID=126358 RepID=A0ABD1QGN6_9LAMI
MTHNAQRTLAQVKIGSKPKIVQDIEEEENGHCLSFKALSLFSHSKRLCSLTKLQLSMKVVIEKKVHRMGFSLSIHYHLCHHTAIFRRGRKGNVFITPFCCSEFYKDKSASSSPNLEDMETRGKQNDVEDDEDGPPPGWEFSILSQALPSNQIQQVIFSSYFIAFSL